MVKDKGNNVIVIGGGAAGMIAAIAAKRNGADVTVLEKNSRVGRKILATGNGRCNLTNTCIDISKYHGKNPEFIYGALLEFDYYKTIDFFENLGIVHKIEDEGKVYPQSLQASSVLDVLRYEMEEIGVNVVCDANVVDIVKKKDFEVKIEDGRVFRGDKVILASGGKASPEFGSNGSGYALARKLGHYIVEPFPALVQLKLSSKYLKQLQGVKFDGDAEIIIEDKVVRSETGEILFTDYGISGPPILQLSRNAGEGLQMGKKVFLRVVIANYLSRQEIEEMLIRRFKTGANKQLAFNFVGLLNKKLIPVIIKEAGIDNINKLSKDVTVQERKRLVGILKDWRFEVTGTNSWTFAQVTAGGIDVKDVYGNTMESKKVSGLYFAGEILDIDGDCGGYNLQWAWSSGYVAGESAAKARS